MGAVRWGVSSGSMSMVLQDTFCSVPIFLRMCGGMRCKSSRSPWWGLKMLSISAQLFLFLSFLLKFSMNY